MLDYLLNFVNHLGHWGYLVIFIIVVLECQPLLGLVMPGESLVERYDADFALNPLHAAIHPNPEGRIAVPQGPGLGIDPDPAVIAKLRVG